MTAPSLNNIKIILENQSYFELDNMKFCYSTEKSTTDPYCDILSQFINTLYDENFIQTVDYPYFTPQQLREDSLNEMDLNTVVKILSGYLQVDRFCSNHITDLIDNEGLLKILDRLKEIYDEIEDRYYGAMLGLAVGDALGAPVEFKKPGTFEKVVDYQSGGPHNVKRGEWTDDTSMALALLESLIHSQGFNPKDQMDRYCKWYDEGYLSLKGYCFDIGNTTRDALETYKKTKNPYSGPSHEMSAGNGALMRIAPIPLFYFSNTKDALKYSNLSSRTTHQHPLSIKSCQYFTGLMIGALRGVSKEKILFPLYCPLNDYWVENPMLKELKKVADGSFKETNPPDIRGRGYVVKSLEAALWAFYNSDNFKDGCLLAVNLGEDADTTGAIYGQLAGAYYGKSGIPDNWLKNLAQKELIESYVSRLINSIPY